MIKRLSFLQKNLTVVIPLMMLAGFVTGLQIDASPLKLLIMPLTFLMVYPMMVTLQLRKIVEGGDLKVQVVTQLLNFTVIPLCALLIGKLFFPDSPYAALGLLLASLLPTSGMTISWTGMARGNVAAAIKITVFGLLIGSVLTPVAIKLLMGAVVDIPLGKIFQQILVVVLLPLVLGNITQQLLLRTYGQAHYQKDIKPVFPPLSTLGVVGVVFVAMALKAQSIAANPAVLAGLIIPLVLLYAINFVISTLVGRLFFSRGDAIALVYGTVMRNLSIALAIAMTAFGKQGSEIALIIALAYIIQVQSAAWYVRFTDRLFGEAPEPLVQDIMLAGVFSLHLGNTLHDALRLLAEEHIHACAVLDSQDRPLGMITAAVILDALADGRPQDTPLTNIRLEPALLIPAKASLKEALARMKRAHEYKILIPDEKGAITHVLTQEEIIRHFIQG